MDHNIIQMHMNSQLGNTQIIQCSKKKNSTTRKVQNIFSPVESGKFFLAPLNYDQCFPTYGRELPN